MMRYAILFVGLACWQTTLLAETLTLEKIVQLTLARNVNIENAALSRVAQRYDVKVAENLFDPKYTFSGDTTFAHAEDQSGNRNKGASVNASPGAILKTPLGTQFTFFWENAAVNSVYNGSTANRFTSGPYFSITQPLIKGFGKTVNTDALQTAREQEMINLLTFKNLINAEITRSIQAYYDLIAAKEALTIQKNAYERAKALEKRTSYLIKEGRLAKNEILEISSQVSQQALNISTAKFRVNQARFNLLNQLDLPIDETIDIDETIHITSMLPKPTLAKMLASQHNVSLQQKKVSLMQAERQFEIAKNQNEWQLDLTFSHQLTGGQSESGFGQAFSNVGHTSAHDSQAGLTFAMPLGNDLARKKSLVAARVNLLQSKRTEKALEREVESRVITDIESLKLLKESLKNQEATLILRRKAAESANLKYNEGRLSAFELTDIQDTLTAAEQSVIDSKISLAKALAEFDTNLGTTMDTWRIQFEKQEGRFDINDH